MKIIKVDLSVGKISEKEIGLKILENWIGGRGLGAYLYSRDVREPEDPQNSVFLMTGAVTGTPLPSSSRTEVISSSPLTGCYQASSAGGYFGAFLRSNAIMGLQITGKSKNWVYLEIKNGEVEIRDAKKLVGLNVYDLRKNLKSGPEVSVAGIGRAGENLVRISSLLLDNRAAGRGGTGWHFGFKKLKVIVVHKNKLPVEGKNSAEMKKLVKELNQKRLSYEQKEDITSYCTPQYTDYASRNFVYPAANYRRNNLSENELEKLGYASFMNKVVEKKACWACPLGCTRITKSKFSPQLVKGPEYETIWALGASPENFDMDVVIEATRLCDDYGLDTISTGATLGWYKECCEKGLVKDKWSQQRFLELIKEIGERKTAGKILAGGSLLASLKIKGSEELLAHSKGMELPAWDPRGAWGMAVCYATSPTGGDHCKGWTVSEDINDGRQRFGNLKGKAERAIEKQNFSAILDSSGFCMFADFMLDWKILARSFNAVVGTKLTASKVKQRSRAIFDLERKINRELGHKLSENVLPERIVDYEIDVEGKKIKLSKKALETLLDYYYKARGWKD